MQPSHSLLIGLGNDDHPQYTKLAGDVMTGTLQADAGDNEIQYLTPNGDWTNYGGSFEDLACWKDTAGTVHLQGLIRYGTVVLVTTLPVGFRPQATGIYSIHDEATGVTYRLDITTAGLVQFNGAIPSNWASFSGISFYVGW